MRQFALKSEWQRRDDRNSIGANSQRLAPLLGEPATQHGPGIVGDIGERSDAHPVCERGMEPNAGGGALAMAAAEIVGKDNMTCYELMPQNVKKLQAMGFALEGPQDFLSVEAMPSFDFVIMNPPFSGGRDVAHIRHAMGFVKAGGKLVAIASTQWRDHDTRPAQSFREYLASLNADIQDIAPGAFREAGTDVATTLITITKPIGVVKKVIHVPSVRQHLQEVLF